MPRWSCLPPSVSRRRSFRRSLPLLREGKKWRKRVFDGAR